MINGTVFIVFMPSKWERDREKRRKMVRLKRHRNNISPSVRRTSYPQTRNRIRYLWRWFICCCCIGCVYVPHYNRASTHSQQPAWLSPSLGKWCSCLRPRLSLFVPVFCFSFLRLFVASTIWANWEIAQTHPSVTTTTTTSSEQHLMRKFCQATWTHRIH